jgi:hypothetical protein
MSTGIAWNPAAQWFVGDFSRDGMADVAEIEPDAQGVSMWFNLGGATPLMSNQLFFSTSFAWPQTSMPWVSGDFDGDGYVDLATMWSNGGLLSFEVLHNDGFGYDAQNWTPMYRGQPIGGAYPANGTLVAGDFNGDDAADLALVNAWGTQGYVTVYTSSRTTWFAPGTTWASFSGYDPQARWLPGDFDGDGNQDLAMVQGPSTNSLKVWVSSGQGFATPVSWGGGTPWQTPAFASWVAGRFL